MKRRAKIEPKCLPNCRLFRCQQRSLKFNKQTQKKTFYCLDLKDECIGAMCKFAVCKEKWINPSRRCGKPQTVKSLKPKTYVRTQRPESSRDWVQSRLSSKAMKHIKGEDYY
ncbi:MAG: hypothetical protein ACFFDT_35990 [Candidatus Hodarchaeota archaeon]